MRLHYEWPCPFCTFIGQSRREIIKHKSENHKGQHKEKFDFLPGGNCKYCNKLFRLKCALNRHEKRCKQNPNAIPVIGHKVSEETKRKISETAKANKKSGGYRHGAGRGKAGWYKGYYCDSSWELAYVIYNLEHNICNFIKNTKDKFEYTFNNEKHFYVPDFKFDDGSYVEVKR